MPAGHRPRLGRGFAGEGATRAGGRPPPRCSRRGRARTRRSSARGTRARAEGRGAPRHPTGHRRVEESPHGLPVRSGERDVGLAEAVARLLDPDPP